MTQNNVIQIDPKPLFELSPWLYMQFMEPLGVTDSSVEAAWDHAHSKWFNFVVEQTKILAPGLMRWGGIFAAYYRWREAVGPRDRRVPMLNVLWGGIETNQIGTGEFAEFCEMVGADKMFCVNFMSEGKQVYARNPDGNDRYANEKEAAEWLDYCNNPDNVERISHGRKEPYNVKLWQIGNETSYGFLEDGFSCEQAARHTVTFAKAMRSVDPSIELIGWGDSGWAPEMLKIAGEHLQYIAFHHHFNSGYEDTVLKGIDYRKDWDRTWEELMVCHKSTGEKIAEMRQQIAGYNVKLAMTESHFALPGRNRNEVLSTWGAGVANARLLNLHERNGDVLHIATLADFCGTRWMNNALYIQHPHKIAFLMPVGHVMSLFRRHVGRNEAQVTAFPDGLDVTASVTRNKLYLHVVNTSNTRSVAVHLHVDGRSITSGKVFELCQRPDWELFLDTRDELSIKELPLSPKDEHTFPPASVSAVELDLQTER